MTLTGFLPRKADQSGPAMNTEVNVPATTPTAMGIAKFLMEGTQRMMMKMTGSRVVIVVPMLRRIVW